MSIQATGTGQMTGLDIKRIIQEEQERIAQEQAEKNSSTELSAAATVQSSSVMQNTFTQVSFSMSFTLELEGYGDGSTADSLHKAVPGAIQKVMDSFRETFAQGLRQLKEGDIDGMEKLIEQFREDVRGVLEDFRTVQDPQAQDLAQQVQQAYNSLRTALLNAFLPRQDATAPEKTVHNIPASEQQTEQNEVAEMTQEARLQQENQAFPQEGSMEAFLQSLSTGFESALQEMVATLDRAGQSAVTPTQYSQRRMLAMYTQNGQTADEFLLQAQAAGTFAIDETA